MKPLCHLILVQKVKQEVIRLPKHSGRGKIKNVMNKNIQVQFVHEHFRKPLECKEFRYFVVLYGTLRFSVYICVVILVHRTVIRIYLNR